MGTTGLLGELEQLVLLAVLRLKERAYAVAIHREIEHQSGIRMSRGSIYVTLDRLEKKGYLKSWFADPTPQRGGKAKRFFRLEPVASQSLLQCKNALLKMWEGVEPRWEEV